MVVDIFLVVDESEHKQTPDRVQGSCPMLRVKAQGSDEDHVYQFLKGAALDKMRRFMKIPDRIEFRIKRKTKQ